MYKEYHSVCLHVGIGTLPIQTPLSSARVPLPPEPEDLDSDPQAVEKSDLD
jgi:hypothetical protein